MFAMFATLRRGIDFFINSMKIPVAVFMLFAIPASIKAFERYWFIKDQLNLKNLICFGAGAVAMFIVRIVINSRDETAETLEHELTHVLFAIMTFHVVHGVRVNGDGSGVMHFSGKGNWLIALSPYCFPLMAVCMAAGGAFYSSFSGMTPDWVYIGIGCAVGYNVHALIQQVHPRQTDFKVASYWFTACFLPGANLLMYGMICAFVERGSSGVAFFLRLVLYYARQLYKGLF